MHSSDSHPCSNPAGSESQSGGCCHRPVTVVVAEPYPTEAVPVQRRTFGEKLIAVLLATPLIGVPLVTGLLGVINPLRPEVRRKLLPGGSDAEGYFKVSSVENLEEDVPQAFTILADRKDAWNRYPQEPIGTVFLLRKGKDVVALNSRCPHAGCDVDFQPAKQGFVCPCHDSLFSTQGVRQGASPSPRDLDVLQVRVEGEGQVWVRFQNYKTGRPDKEPV